MKPVTFLDLPWFPDKVDLESSTCEHCGCEIRDYRYPIHSCHTQFLQALHRHGEPAVKKELDGLSKSAYTTGTQVWRWNLIRSVDRANRGPWVVTELGMEFMAGKLAIPRCAVVRMLAGQKSPLLRFEGEPIDFHTASKAHKGRHLYGDSVADLRDARRQTKDNR